jgi:hypothetical protein
MEIAAMSSETPEYAESLKGVVNSLSQVHRDCAMFLISFLRFADFENVVFRCLSFLFWFQLSRGRCSASFSDKDVTFEFGSRLCSVLLEMSNK